MESSSGEVSYVDREDRLVFRLSSLRNASQQPLMYVCMRMISATKENARHGKLQTYTSYALVITNVALNYLERAAWVPPPKTGRQQCTPIYDVMQTTHTEEFGVVNMSRHQGVEDKNVLKQVPPAGAQ